MQEDKYPFGTLPREGEDYDFADYIPYLNQNLSSPLRIYRSAMLDLINLLCPAEGQRKQARERVFVLHNQAMELFDNWFTFYGLYEDGITQALEELP